VARRHDALIPLSHDHHHALHELRLLRDAASGDDATRRETADSFVRFFIEHSVTHFREEEEELLPLVIEDERLPRSVLARVLLEHVEIHALVKRLDADADAQTMRELAALLRAHIRFEEDELFPAIERLVADRLPELALMPRMRSTGR
jgi:hemerythrin-like domain-containing protein